MRRRAWLSTLGALAVGPAVVVGAGAAARSGPAPLRIGQSAPLTGPLARVGTAVRDTAVAVFELANRNGGVRGSAIELVSLDDEDRPERTAVNVKLLAAQHEVIALFGFVGAGAHRAGARGASEEGLPYLAPFSGAEELRSGLLPRVYHLRAGHREEIDYIVRHTRLIGIRRVSLVSEYNSQGWELRDGLIEALTAHGDGTASISSVDHEGSEHSLPGAVASVLAGRPQAILLGADYVASARFVTAARMAGYRGLFYTLSTVGGHALIERLGSEAHGLSVTQVVPFPWSQSTPVGREFLAFCAQRRLEVSFASMEAYLAARLLVDALRRAREGTTAALAAALDAMPPHDFGGFVGAFYGRSRRAPAQIDLTVFSRAGKFVR